MNFDHLAMLGPATAQVQRDLEDIVSFAGSLPDCSMEEKPFFAPLRADEPAPSLPGFALCVPRTVEGGGQP